MKINRFAFTLAEILITLAIIGIVASITTPTLIGNYKKQAYATQIKAVFYELNEAIDLLLTEESKTRTLDTSLYTNILPDGTSVDGVDNFMNTYFTVVQKCVNGAGNCFAAKYNNSANNNPCRRYTAYVLNSGVALCPRKSSNSTNITFYIDINGIAGPNSAGRDLFHAKTPITDDIQEFIDMSSNNCRDFTSTTSTYGQGCIKKLQENNWKMNY